MKNGIKELFAEYYGLNLITFKPMHDGSDNIVYLIDTDKGAFVFRISKKYKSNNDFKFETDFIDYLYKENIPVPKPIYNIHGSIITEWDGISSCLFTFCSGTSLKIDKDHLPTPRQAFNAGIMLAKFHNTSKDYQPNIDPQRKMRTELERLKYKEKEFLSKYEQSEDFVKAVKDVLANSLIYKTPDCIIHNDFRAQNLLFEKDNITAILDFDWACRGCALKDLGHALAEWSYPDGATEHSAEIFKEFLNGYETIRPNINMNELHEWIYISCLSDAVTYFMDRLYPIDEVKPLKSYMYRKYLYFKGKNIANLT